MTKDDIAEAPDGARGFDTATPLTALQCAALAAAGMKFAVRYVGFHGPVAHDLGAAEVDRILDAGLALMVVQHVRFPGWSPSAALGAEDGARAVENALAARLPKGVNIWCDLEGIKGTAGATIAHANAWTAAVRSGGYDPGVYIGFGVPLTSAQMFSDLTVRRYWRSQSSVPDVMTRGYQMTQLAETVVAGVRIDPDVIATDRLGDRPVWLKRALVTEPVLVG